MARRVASRVFAGRATELGALLAALGRAADGAASVVLVGGEAGVGKTRLLAELRDRAVRGGVRVLWGDCVGLEEAAIPLLPVADALRGLAADDGDADRPGDDGEQDPLRGGIPPPASAGLLAPGAGAAARPHARVLATLAHVAASAPVLLVLEDVHWADRSTLDLLAYLTRRLRKERILVVASFRIEDAERRERLRRFLADVATAPRLERLQLVGLSGEEMREQMAGIGGVLPPEALVREVVARSGGNPFFAEELLAAATGSVDELSPTLRDVLLARIDALPADARRVVEVAAVGGRHVHHRLLAAAARVPEPELTDALREAVRHHVLIARDDGFAFRHALVQEVACGELLPGERMRLHAAFADALEAGPAVAGGNAATVAAELAHHRSLAGDDARALAAAVHAGVEAERVGALAEAAGHHAHALALWPVVPDADRRAGIDRATLLARAANATAWTGDPAEAVLLVDAAIELVEAADAPAAAALHQRRGLYLWWLERGREAVRDFERAVELTPPEPPSIERARALARLGFILMLTNEHERSRDCCEAAVAVARTVGARVEEADALASLGVDLVALGDRPAGLRCLRRARSIAAEIGDEELLSQTAIALSFGLTRDGRLTEAVEVALAGADESRRAGADMREGLCRLNAAEAAYELGRWDLVERLTDEALARDPSGATLAFAHHMAGALARERGDLAAAADHALAERAVVGEESTPESASYALEAEAELALAEGRPEAASQAALEGLRVLTEDATRSLLMAAIGLRAEADRAEVARARRDVDAAEAARERANRFLHVARRRAPDADHPALAATAEAEHARAEGRSDPTRWAAAAQAWEDRRAPLEAARACRNQAEAALMRRDRAQATTALRQAHGVAVGLGAAGLQAEVEALARRARVSLDERSPSGPEAAPEGAAAAADFGLTPRETEILGHLVRGETNRQIAGELYISVKTASLHVSHILGKLGAANRVEAAAIAHRLHLVP